MTWFSTYDIANPDTPPWWIGLIPSMRRLWQNPVAQFNYRHGKLSVYPLILVWGVPAFLISLILNLLIAQGNDDYAPLIGLTITMSLPAAGWVLFIAFWFLPSCLVITSIRIRRWLESGLFSSVLPTPLSDARIFNGVLFPGLVRGLLFTEMMYGLSFGLVLGFVLVFHGKANDILPRYETGILLFLAAPILLTCLLTYASGLYSLMMPTVIAVPVALVHVALSLVFMYLIRGVYHLILHLQESLLIFFIGDLITVGILAGIIVLTAKIGVMVFARYRRPGFFETEWASAAGLASWE